MLLLAVDTSTSAIGAAVHDGTTVRSRATVEDARGHAEHLAPLVSRVLAEAGIAPRDLDLIVAGTGPGPFTGLRVGLVTAAVLGHTVDAPVHGIPSLDALAAQALIEHPQETAAGLVVATDARRKEVYWARYAGSAADAGSAAGAGSIGGDQAPAWGLAHPLAEAAVQRPADLSPDLMGLPVVGRGGRLYPDAFGTHLGLLDVDPAVLAELAVRRLAAGEELGPPTPAYLRRPDALTTAERAQAAAAAGPLAEPTAAATPGQA